MTAREISVTTVFAAVPVRDLDAAARWYTSLLGRGPDDHPSPTVIGYYLTESREPERGTLQLTLDPVRAGGGRVTVNVPDIEVVREACSRLAVAFKVNEFNIRADTVTSVLVGVVEDPDGNALTFVEPRP